MAIILKMSAKTARHLSYMIGRSEEANAVVGAATQAARAAENNVRDLIAMVADQSGNKLPDNYAIKFEEDSNEVVITAHEPVVQDAPVMPINVNGVKET